MPPIHMSRQERATLARLAESPVPLSEVPPGHMEKFISHGLAVRDVFRFKITTKGQLELYRQRFRNMTTRRKVRTSEHDFLGMLDRHMARVPRSPTMFFSLNDDD